MMSVRDVIETQFLEQNLKCNATLAGAAFFKFFGIKCPIKLRGIVRDGSSSSHYWMSRNGNCIDGHQDCQIGVHVWSNAFNRCHTAARAGITLIARCSLLKTSFTRLTSPAACVFCSIVTPENRYFARRC